VVLTRSWRLAVRTFLRGNVANYLQGEHHVGALSRSVRHGQAAVVF